MEDLFFGALALAAFFFFLVAPVAAWVSAARARREVEREKSQGEIRESQLRWLYEENRQNKARVDALEQRIRTLEGREPARAAPTSQPADPTPSPVDPTPAPAVIAASQRPEPSTPPEQGAPAANQPTPPPEPPTQPIAPAAPPRPAPPAPRLEERLGTYFTRIGAAALVLGLLYFFKYAVDNAWIGPTGRVAVGVVVGLSFLAASEPLARRTRPAFLHAIIGLGLATLLIASFAASALYALLPTELDFAVNCVVLLLGVALAVRHRGEAILVLALVAAFLNPVILSTGEDRPLALFAYLLVMTGVMATLSVKLGFRVAITVALLGNLVLFMGWYDRFFDIHDLRGVLDDEPDTVLGPYFNLWSRAVPLAFVALTSAEWVALGFVGPRWGRGPTWSVVLVLVGLLLAHGGLIALLVDAPLALGAALIAVGLAAALSLAKLGRTELLFIPMSAALVAFAVASGASKDSHVSALLTLMGLWTALYVVLFGRALQARADTVSPSAIVGAALALVGFVAIAASLLLSRGQLFTFTALLTAAAVVAAYLAQLAELSGLAMGALAVGLGFWVLTAPDLRRGEEAADPRLLGVLAAWTATQLVSLSWLARRATSRSERTEPHLLAVAVALVGSLGVVIASTPPELETLRALWSTLSAAAALGLATWARPVLRAWAEPLAALALGLIAVALGLALSGATLTLAWSLLFAVAAGLSARAGSRGLQAAALVLGVAVLYRAVAVDIGGAEGALQTWRNTQGREGLYRLEPWKNARALAVCGAGLAALFAAWSLARAPRTHPGTDEPPERIAAAISAVLGYIGLAFVVLSELRGAVLELPTPPVLWLDPEEFAAFMSTVFEAEAQQAASVAVAMTLGLGGIAMLLLGLGFGARDPFHRYLGLAAFVLTIGKLALWDVWNLPRTYQIIVLVAVGLLLLGSGFLYARLKSLFQGPETLASWLLVASLLLGAHEARADTPAPRVDPSVFRQVRAIEGLSGPGDYAVPVDVALYQASMSNPVLQDLRVVDANDRAVPHVIRPVVAPPAETAWDQVAPDRIFDSGLLDDSSARATFELRARGPHCQAELQLDGPRPFLRRVRVETGDDPQSMATISDTGAVYVVYAPARGGEVQDLVVRYPASRAAYVRITLGPPSDAHRHTLTGARFACPAAPTPAERPYDELPVKLTPIQQDERNGETDIELDIGAEGLPLEAVELDIATPEFSRLVTVLASSSRTAWPAVTTTYLYRFGGTDSASGLRVRLEGLRKRYVMLRVDNGDDAPLEFKGAKATVLRRELVLRAPAGGAPRLLVGAPNVGAARYDLERILTEHGPTPLPPARLGPATENPDLGKARPAADAPWSEQNRGLLRVGLGIVLVGLAAWAIRLLRGGGPLA